MRFLRSNYTCGIGDKAKEAKERQEREAQNRAHAGESYHTLSPSEMKDDDELSGLPWGSLSLKHVVSKGKDLKDKEQRSRQESGDLYYESEDTEYFYEGYSE